MAIIYSYPLAIPDVDDLVIGTKIEGGQGIADNQTVNYSIRSVLSLIASTTGQQNLQQVTNVGATTNLPVIFESDIKVSGRYYDSLNSPGTIGQILSSTVGGTKWINSPASGVTSVTGSSPITSTGGTTPQIGLADTTVAPGNYTNTNLTVDAKGRITTASNGAAGGITGSGGANQITFWDSNSTVTGESDFVYEIDLNNNGHVGINVSDPNSYFTGTDTLVISAGGTGYTGVTLLSTANAPSSINFSEGKTITDQKGGISYIHSPGSNNGLRFKTDQAFQMELFKNGQFALNTYGSGTVTGTAAYNLSVDSSGNVIETANLDNEQTFVLTAAQMQGLTTPFQLLAAPGANKTYKILELSTYLNFQSQFSGTSSSLNIFTTDQPTPLIEVGQSVSDGGVHIQAGTTVTSVTSQTQIEISLPTVNGSMSVLHTLTFTRTDTTTFTRTTGTLVISQGTTNLNMALGNINGGDGLQCLGDVSYVTLPTTSEVRSFKSSNFRSNARLYVNQPLMISTGSAISGGTGNTFSIKIKYQILDTNNF